MTDFELALDHALQLQARGTGLDAILARYPQYAADLKPLLEAARVARLGLMKDAPVPAPDLRRGRERFLRTALRPSPHERDSTRGLPILRAAAALALAVVLVTLTAVGLVSASGSALPGDPLYPARLAFERIELALTLDPAERQSMETRLEAQRRLEAQTVAAQGRRVRVQFEGVVERVESGSLIVSGLTVRTDGTRYGVGDRVRVDARTDAGQIVAEQIRITVSATAAPTLVGPERTRTGDQPETDIPPGTGVHLNAATRTLQPSASPTAARPTATATASRPEPSATVIRPTTATPATRPLDTRPTPTPATTASDSPTPITDTQPNGPAPTQTASRRPS
jgi:hypothetical protein